jgi:hypothetical protein
VGGFQAGNGRGLFIGQVHLKIERLKMGKNGVQRDLINLSAKIFYGGGEGK